MKLDLDDLIENLDTFSDDHLYALIGGSLEKNRTVPQGGFALAEGGRKFFDTFVQQFRGAICENGGLRDQVKKVASAQTQRAMIPVITTWVVARGGAAGLEITQVVAIYVAILMARVTLDTLCHGYRAAK
ncbi:MAG TPA: hypothetical protein VGI18_08655 [Burkholderiales bacterium]|jgi:hypothetical protein